MWSFVLHEIILKAPVSTLQRIAMSVQVSLGAHAKRPGGRAPKAAAGIVVSGRDSPTLRATPASTYGTPASAVFGAPTELDNVVAEWDKNQTPEPEELLLRLKTLNANYASKTSKEGYTVEKVKTAFNAVLETRQRVCIVSRF